MTSTRVLALATLMALAACSGSEPAAPEAPAEAEKPAEAAPETPAIDAAELEKGSENVAVVPSPVETQSALEKAGIDTQLNTLIKPHDFKMDAADVDNASVRTGVVLADMILTVKSSEKAELLVRVEAVRMGMEQLEGGKDIDAMLIDIKERVNGDSVTREELLKELDELSGAVIPELEFNGKERVVPLIQAGSWLQGANLVARAVKDAGKPEAADTMLKQPGVVDYFIKYVKTDGADKAPAQVTAKLEESLNTLKGLATKAEPLTAEDIDTVITVTDNVLALL